MLVLLTYGALTVAALLLAARLLPDAPPLERATAAALLVPALSVCVVLPLGWLWWISAPAYAACCVAVMALASVGSRSPMEVLARDREAWGASLRALRHDPVSVAALLLAFVAVALGVWAAALLPVWAWDALGYHLPIVHDALATGGFREIPSVVVYLNAYPRAVDLSFVAWRLAVGTEDWVELAQLPFVPLGVLSIATLAARGGVPGHRALAMGSLFVAIPVVMLQLPSAYIDLAVASLVLASFVFVTGPLDRGHAVLAAVASGFLLASKPSTPPIVAGALLVFLVRSARVEKWGQAAMVVLLAAMIGSSKYLENLVEHGNPVWPVSLHLGPLAFPGDVAASELAVAGLPERYRSMGYFARLASSWFAMPDLYIHDMRMGGFGPLFVLGLLPIACVALAVFLRRPSSRRRLAAVGLPVLLIAVFSLLSPGAHWSRYTIAFPAALLALAATLLELAPAKIRMGVMSALVALAALGMLAAFPGFSARGPDLLTLARMTPTARMRAFGLDEQELDWNEARESVGPGEAFGYDPSFGLPGRLVRRDGASRVVYFDEESPTFEELDRWLASERIRVVALSDPGTADLARTHPERFRQRFVSLHPEWQACAVFDVLP